jgi:hypothetical protein
VLVEELLGGDVDRSIGTSLCRVLLPPDHVRIRALPADRDLVATVKSPERAGAAVRSYVIQTQHRGAHR